MVYPKLVTELGNAIRMVLAYSQEGAMSKGVVESSSEVKEKGRGQVSSGQVTLETPRSFSEAVIVNPEL